MNIGNRNMAKSFIVLKSGQTFYLANSFADIKKQIKREKKIEVNTAEPSSVTYKIYRQNIEYYGKVD